MTDPLPPTEKKIIKMISQWHPFLYAPSKVTEEALTTYAEEILELVTDQTKQVRLDLLQEMLKECNRTEDEDGRLLVKEFLEKLGDKQ